MGADPSHAHQQRAVDINGNRLHTHDDSCIVQEHPGTEIPAVGFLGHQTHSEKKKRLEGVFSSNWCLPERCQLKPSFKGAACRLVPYNT